MQFFNFSLRTDKKSGDRERSPQKRSLNDVSRESHSASRTGVEPNCPTTMHFRIFRWALARKMVITEESQIIRPATSNFCVLCRNSPCKMRILLRLASTKSIKNCNAGGCFAVLSEQIFCRCKEKMRSNIRYCKHFICRRCEYLSHKTVWVRLSSAIANVMVWLPLQPSTWRSQP